MRKWRILGNSFFWQTRKLWKFAQCSFVPAAYNAMSDYLFSVSLPYRTHNCSLNVVSVVLIPECLTRLCVCLTRRFSNVCLASKRIGDLLEVSSEAFMIWPLHLMIWSSLANNPNWATWIGGLDLQSLDSEKKVCWWMLSLELTCGKDSKRNKNTTRMLKQASFPAKAWLHGSLTLKLNANSRRHNNMIDYLTVFACCVVWPLVNITLRGYVLLWNGYLWSSIKCWQLDRHFHPGQRWPDLSQWNCQ